MKPYRHISTSNKFTHAPHRSLLAGQPLKPRIFQRRDDSFGNGRRSLCVHSRRRRLASSEEGFIGLAKFKSRVSILETHVQQVRGCNIRNASKTSQQFDTSRGL